MALGLVVPGHPVDGWSLRMILSLLSSRRIREVTNVFRQRRLTTCVNIVGHIGRHTHTYTRVWSAISPGGGEGQEVVGVVLQVHTPRDRRHHFPPSRRQRRRKPATILLFVQPIRRVSPCKSHRVMQYNTWKRVSPSNPVSSHPACSTYLSLSLSLHIQDHPAIAATVPSPKLCP